MSATDDERVDAGASAAVGAGAPSGGRQLRIVLIARPALGAGGLSARVAAALEAAGHLVFWFGPRDHGWLFGQDDLVDLNPLEAFLRTQRPDALIFADGLLPAAAPNVPGCAWGLLAEVAPTRAFVLAAQQLRPHFILSCTEAAARAYEGLGMRTATFEPGFDEAWASSRLANEIAYPPGLLCLQDATTERLAFVKRLEDEGALCGLPVRCFGRGWPERYGYGPAQPEAGTAFAYAVRSSYACVSFAGPGNAEGAQSAASLSIVLQEGCPLVRVGDNPRAEFDRIAELARAASAPAVSAAPADDDASALPSGGPAGGGGAASDTPRRDIESPWTLPFAGERTQARARGAVGAPDGNPLAGMTPLVDGLTAAFSQIQDALASEGLMRGFTGPRAISCVLGYFGLGNFGDEYILTTIDGRLRGRMPGAAVVAVCEHPREVLTNRGIYAVGLADKPALDAALARSSCALVVAGLLFDQGIRWTAGLSEAVAGSPYTDLPGIAGYVQLAEMRDCQPVFYGIGAGPLDLPDSRLLVERMGAAGALFLTRDRATSRLIAECGVMRPQIFPRADIAFLGNIEACECVDTWLADEGIDMQQDLVVAVSLRDYENTPTDFAARVAEALARVAGEYPQAQFALCAVDPADERMLGDVADELDAWEEGAGRAHLFRPGQDIAATADLLTRCHLGLSMRYHASLVMGASGRPVAGIGYLPKVESLFSQLDSADVLLSPTATADQMAAALLELAGDYGPRRARVYTGAEAMRKKAAEAEDLLLEALMRGAAAKAGAIPRTFYLRTTSIASDAATEAAARAEAAEQAATRLLAERDAARAEADALRASRSFKLGNALVRPFARFKRK